MIFVLINIQIFNIPKCWEFFQFAVAEFDCVSLSYDLMLKMQNTVLY